MIDLHCHLLDGTGCGPGDFGESLEMCRRAAEDGVRTAVATPRWDASAAEPPLPFAECRRKLDRLNEGVGPALTFELGFMMQFRADLPLLVDRYGRSLTLGGGRYVLVSLPPFRVPAEAEEVWGELRRRGYSVVLARPECGPALRRDQPRLERWVASGVVLQIDAASVTGLHGREVQQFALQCVQKYGMSVLVASNARHRDARFPSLGAARERLKKLSGSRRAERLVNVTPASIIYSGERAGVDTDAGAQQASLLTRLRPLRAWKALADAR